ncbi:MAG: polysaccharide deacetylase family protein [Planctomycetota bacterium]
MFPDRRAALFPEGHPPVLLLVVDTEEEFEWEVFDRSATSVAAMSEIHRFQDVCDEFGAKPTYVVDYPVATQAEGYEPLRAISADHRAVIGAHLHPWVNPPDEEEVGPFNSFPGNLPADLERAKLSALTDAIERNFGDRPTIYKAGRYGFGQHTAQTLADLGYMIDMSLCPSFDFREIGGPDFAAEPAGPFWFGETLELPTTAGFVGYMRGVPALLGLIQSAAGKALRIGGILGRLGAFDRIRLSPEGDDCAAHRRLTRTLLADGVSVFTMSLHSPSMKVGGTPYVKTAAARDAFVESIRSYLRFFTEELGGRCVTPMEIHALLAQERRSESR